MSIIHNLLLNFNAEETLYKNRVNIPEKRKLFLYGIFDRKFKKRYKKGK